MTRAALTTTQRDASGKSPVARRLRKTGRWRVVAQYSGVKPFLAASSKRIAFRAR